ncbi:MAG: hypothetical protein RL336_723, partial [Pseudomonadota bacterium]
WGNDVIEFASDSVDYINGEYDTDIIQFVTTEALDFTASTLAYIDNVEIFELGAGDQDIKLDGTNIADFVTGTNSVADNATYQGKKLLVIDSTAGSDSLELVGFTDTGDTTTINGGSDSFSVYYDSTNDVYVATDLTATLS